MTTTKAKWNTLVGKFFHEFDHNSSPYVKLQGQVVGQLPNGDYVVELYEWLAGTFRARQIKQQETFSFNKIWLYETAEEMRYAYEYLIPTRPEEHA